MNIKTISKNWKTTLAGIVFAGVALASSQHWISEEAAKAILTLAATFGLLAAKDGNVTGKP